MSELLRVARATLKRCFGYDDFRPGQIDVVQSVLSRRDTLGVLPTGGGKSLCYQVPALVMPGVTIVISPLVSLMKDQVDRLTSRGVAAALVNSTLSADDVAKRLGQLARGDLKLLYVAPERFEASDLQRSLQRATIALLAVDEAHCISEWGHDFRPSFRRIAEVSERLGRPQVVALTATATPRVRADIVRQLRMRGARVIVSGFDRDNLHYSVRPCRGHDDKMPALLEALRAHAQPAIVYASTRSSVEHIAKRLTRAGVRAVPYHAGLDDTHRHDIQETFMRGKVATIVATNAFGMGIDKSDVRLVAHFAMPGTLEAYYQEAGRAGRDGQLSHCVLLHARNDRCTHEWFIRGMYPDRGVVERVYAQLAAGSVDARVERVPTGRDAASAIRLLLRAGALTQRNGIRSPRVRLLATPARIARELSTGDATDLPLLRGLWRRCGEALMVGASIDLTSLSPISAREAKTSLLRLRSRQFVDVDGLDNELFLVRPDAPLASFSIDWVAIEARKSADLEKLQAMERYAYSTQCRRAFVLRYFGESRVRATCDGCDNCSRR